MAALALAALLLLPHRAAAPASTVEGGLFQLGGQPFLPWGVYMAAVTDQDLAIIQDAG